jgi:hypothetical protein
VNGGTEAIPFSPTFAMKIYFILSYNLYTSHHIFAQFCQMLFPYKASNNICVKADLL